MELNLNFFEVAQRAIKNYYREFGGSLQNTSHSKALQYSLKVENLRTNFLNYLKLSNFLLSLQPSSHYLEKIIFNFLNTKASNWAIFTNKLEPKIHNFFLHSLEEFLKLEKLNNPTFICINAQQIELSLIEKVFKKLSDLKGESKQPIYSYLTSTCLNQLKEEFNSYLKDISFFSYDPSLELFEFGAVFFGFNREIQLKPVFLGSGGAKFEHSSKSIKLKELPHLLEIGTQNLIPWIVLAEYFEEINRKK